MMKKTRFASAVQHQEKRDITRIIHLIRDVIAEVFPDAVRLSGHI